MLVHFKLINSTLCIQLILNVSIEETNIWQPDFGNEIQTLHYKSQRIINCIFLISFSKLVNVWVINYLHCHCSSVLHEIYLFFVSKYAKPKVVLPAEIYFLQWTSWQLTVSMQFSNQSWGLFYFASIYPTDQFLDVFLWPWKCKYI